MIREGHPKAVTFKPKLEGSHPCRLKMEVGEQLPWQRDKQVQKKQADIVLKDGQGS